MFALGKSSSYKQIISWSVNGALSNGARVWNVTPLNWRGHNFWNVQPFPYQRGYVLCVIVNFIQKELSTNKWHKKDYPEVLSKIFYPKLSPLIIRHFIWLIFNSDFISKIYQFSSYVGHETGNIYQSWILSLTAAVNALKIRFTFCCRSDSANLGSEWIWNVFAINLFTNI